MKNLPIAIVTLIFLFALIFWTKPASNSDKLQFQVAVLIPGTVEFFAVQKRGLNEAAKQYNLNLIYADAEWEPAKQLAQVENFIARKVDLILLCSVDNLALQRAVPLTKKAGIPLMTFSNTIGEDPNGLYEGVVAHIGRDEVKSGVMLGHMVEGLAKDKSIKIVLVQGAPGTSAQRMREEGFKSILEKHSNWEIVFNHFVPGWTKEGALNGVQDFLQTGKKTDIVVAQWWTGAIAAAMALKEKKLDGVKVVGLEYSKELIPYLMSGEVSQSTYFSIKEEGFKAVETAGLFLNKREIPKFVEIVPTIVNGQNVDRYKAEL
jgi:ribose transport system substrate-binding protein